MCLSGNPLKSDWGRSNYFPLFGVLTLAAVLSPSLPPLILDPRCGRAIPLWKVPLFPQWREKPLSRIRTNPVVGFRGGGVLIRGRPALLGWPLCCPVWTIKVSLLCCCRNVEVEIRRLWFSKATFLKTRPVASERLIRRRLRSLEFAWEPELVLLSEASTDQVCNMFFALGPSSLVSPSVPERGRFKAAVSLLLIRPVFSVCLHLHVSL